MRYGLLLFVFIQSFSFGQPVTGYSSSLYKKILPGRFIIRTPIHKSATAFGETSAMQERLFQGIPQGMAKGAQVKPLFRQPVQRKTFDKNALSSVSANQYLMVNLPELKKGNNARQNTLRFIDELKTSHNLEIFPDYEMKLSLSSNDTYATPSTGAWGQSYENLWGLTLLRTSQAWEQTKGADQIVAVIDTGVDHNHPDLLGKVLLGQDFIDGGEPMDTHGHGTHVAGTIAAHMNNSMGIVGVAPDAKILAIRVVDGAGSGSFGDLATAIEYATDNGATVINISLGLSLDAELNLDETNPISEAIGYAVSRGVPVVVAAGNDAREVAFNFPARDANVIAVSAVDQNSTPASYTNYGSRIAVGAPGGGGERSILSLLSAQAADEMTGSGELIVGQQYLRQNGTSMAAPHVAGVAALLRSQHTTWTPGQIRQALQHSACGGDPNLFSPRKGYGIANAATALEETEPLDVRLTAPLRTSYAIQYLQIPVYGNVSGAGLSSWELQVGRGEEPAEWTTLAQGTQSISGFIYGEETPVGDGLVTYRLTATHANGKKYSDRTTVLLDLFYLAGEPLSIDWITAGVSQFDLIGSILMPGSHFSARLLNSNRGVVPANIALSNGGVGPVDGSNIATVDLGGLNGGLYILEITVQHLGQQIKREKKFYIDRSLRTGFPKIIGSGTTTSSAPVLSLANFGSQKRIVAVSDRIDLLDASGILLPGWRKYDRSARSGNISPLAIADNNGDGNSEIFLKTTSYPINMIGYDLLGSRLPGFQSRILGGFSNLIAANLMGDSGVYLVHSSDYSSEPLGNIAVANSQGVLQPGWPVVLNQELLEAPSLAVGNIDNSGELSIIAVYGEIRPDTGMIYHIRVLDPRGVVKPGWPVTLEEPNSLGNPTPPVLADIDGDGALEIFFGTYSGAVYGYRGNGASLAGWPIRVSQDPIKNLIVADLNQDGINEVVISTSKLFYDTNHTFCPTTTFINRYQTFYYLFNTAGEQMYAWPVIEDPRCRGIYWDYKPILADADGDGISEIIFVGNYATSNPEFPTSGVHALKWGGRESPGYPKLLPNYAESAAVAAADIDGNGRLELLVMDFQRNLFVWSLAGNRSPWPQWRGNPGQTGAFTGPSSLPPRVSLQFTTPQENAFIGGVVPINVTATSQIGTVTKVELYKGPVLLGTDTAAPYVFSLDTASQPEGPLTLTAKAYHSSGTSYLKHLPVIVDNVHATVGFKSPSPGSVAGGVVPVQVDALPISGSITKVELYNGAVLLGSRTSAPHHFSLDTNAFPEGSLQLTAKAYHSSGTTHFASTHFTVDHDILASVSFLSPQPGTNVWGIVPVEIAATAFGGNITRVELYAGNSRIGQKATVPYQFSFHSPLFADSSITLKAIAYHSSGKSYSVTRDVGIKNYPSQGVIPMPLVLNRSKPTTLVVQTDYKIVVAGYSRGGSGNENKSFSLIRYLPNGAIDTTFGTQGMVHTDMGKQHVGNEILRHDDEAKAIVLQPDGKLVVGGYAISQGQVNGAAYLYRRFALARYTANGTLDSSFGTDGKIFTEMATQRDSEIAALALQPDGKIIAVGYTTAHSQAGVLSKQFAVARYHPNGILDKTFSKNGRVTLNMGFDQDAEAFSVALQPDGMFIVAGYASVAANNSVRKHFALARFTPNGSLDPSINWADRERRGRIYSEMSPNFHSAIKSVQIDSSNRIVVAGRLGTSEQASSARGIAMARYLPTGVLDTSFGQNGKFFLRVEGNRPCAAETMRLQTDGKILLAGFCMAPGATQANALMARVLSDGTRDSVFADSGVLSLASPAFGSALAFQSNRILLLGTNDIGSVSLLMRLYQTNGAPDSSFRR